MAEHGTALAQFKDDGPLDVYELSYFLFLFRAVYVAASERVRDDSTPPEVFAEKLRYELTNDKYPYDDVNLARKELDHNLTIIGIRRESPLEILFAGLGAALVVALIISGGKVTVSLKQVKVELPPLGHGIAKLREAFGKKPQKPRIK
jgi:hypothetical protein